MADKKQELPFGWIVKQSKSHPDRIYYFNVNTGASTWEFPDLLQHYVNGKGNTVEAPVLSATLLKSGNTDAVTGSSSKSLATHVAQKRPQAPPGSDTQTKPAGSRKRTLQESNCAPKLDLVCETVNRTMSPEERFVSRHKKKLQENLSKSVDKSFHGTKSKVDQFDLKKDPKRPKESSKSVHTAPLPLSGGRAIHSQKQLEESRAAKQEHKRTEKKSGDSKTETSHVPLKTVKQKNQTELSDTLLSLIKSRLPGQGEKRKATGSSKARGEADVYKSLHVINKCVRSLGSCLNEKKKIYEKKSVEQTECQGNKVKLQTQENKKISDKAEKLKTDTNAGTSSSEKTKNMPSYTYKDYKRKMLPKDTQSTADTRKVVRSSQSSSTDNRNVSLKDKKISNLPMNEKLKPTLDMTVSTSAAQVSNCSIPAEDDGNVVSEYNYDTSTEFKVFIGDKEKLMSIQSWINNLQENTGSASPAVDTQAVLGLVNDSADSGYLSPGNAAPTPLKRGWPGDVKKTDNTSREVVVMEVDECLLPQSSPTDYDEECMDIGDVLVEVRQQVCSSNIKPSGSFINSLSESDQSQLSGTDQSQQGITNDHIITIVVDTNILIHDLNLLERLKDFTLSGCNMKPCLFIPWIVLRELDALKDTVKSDRLNMSLATQKRARKGISFLKELFSSKHPRVKGQTPKQADEAATNFKSVGNDDVILQACLQCQKSARHVVLLTNDNNLTNKALVSGVPAFNAKDIISGLQKASESMVANQECPTPSKIQCTTQESVQCQTPVSAQRLTPACVQGLTPVHVADINPGVQCQTVSAEKGTSSQLIQRDGNIEDVSGQNLVKCDQQTVLPSPCKLQQTCLVDKRVPCENTCYYTVDALVDDIYMRMLALLKEALGQILEVEMKKAYDDIWTDIVYIKPPWNLRDILQCLKKHWIAVFGLVFSRHLSKNVHMLLDYTSISNRITVDTVCDVGVESSEILEEAKTRNVYGPRIPAITQTVVILRDLCFDIKLGNVSAQSIPSLEQYILSEVDRLSTRSVQSVQKVTSANCQAAQHISAAVINTVQSTSETGIGGVLLPDCVQTVSSPAPQTGPQLPDNSSLQPAGPLQSVGGEQGPSAHSEADSGNQIKQAESIAGERFSQIWKFIYKHCNEFYAILSGTAVVDTSKMEPVLKELVSSSLDLRKYYSGLLELPVDVLKNHEKEFTALSSICNTFFSKFEIQEASPLVTPIHLLILYSQPQYRGTLQQFLGQLDEMLHVMYQCLNKLCPD